MFFIPYDNWNVLFFENVNFYYEVLSNHRVLAFFEISNLKEILILHFISTLTAQTNAKVPNVYHSE